MHAMTAGGAVLALALLGSPSWATADHRILALVLIASGAAGLVGLGAKVAPVTTKKALDRTVSPPPAKTTGGARHSAG